MDFVFQGKPVGTPDPGAFFRVLKDHDVVGMFTAPTAIRAIMKEDETGEKAKKYPLDKLVSENFIFGKKISETRDGKMDFVHVID